jgi:hypothetical protein
MRLENENGSVKTAFGPQTVVEIRYRPELDPSDGAGAGSRTRREISALFLNMHKPASWCRSEIPDHARKCRERKIFCRELSVKPVAPFPLPQAGRSRAGAYHGLPLIQRGRPLRALAGVTGPEHTCRMNVGTTAWPLQLAWTTSNAFGTTDGKATVRAPLLLHETSIPRSSDSRRGSLFWLREYGPDFTTLIQAKSSPLDSKTTAPVMARSLSHFPTARSSRANIPRSTTVLHRSAQM